MYSSDEKSDKKITNCRYLRIIFKKLWNDIRMYLQIMIGFRSVPGYDIVSKRVYSLFVVYLSNKFHVGYFILAVLALKSHFNLCESIAYRETIWAFGGMYLQRAVPKDIEIVISYDRVE